MKHESERTLLDGDPPHRQQQDTDVDRTAVADSPPRWRSIQAPGSAKEDHLPTDLLADRGRGTTSAPLPNVEEVDLTIESESLVIVEQDVPAPANPSEPPHGRSHEPPRDAR
jgi:hypothetical protein